MDKPDIIKQINSSHLFQRVASFLPWGLLFFNHTLEEVFSSLSESGFIPTPIECITNRKKQDDSSHLFQRVASFLLPDKGILDKLVDERSHLFQRVASFLQRVM